MDCLFCGIVAGTVEASVVYEDERLLAFCDLFPVNPGHLPTPRQELDAVAARVRSRV